MLHIARCTHSYIVMEKMDCDLHSLIRANIIPADVARSIIFQVEFLRRSAAPRGSYGCFAAVRMRVLLLVVAAARQFRCLFVCSCHCSILLFVVSLGDAFQRLALRVPDHLCDEVHARPEGVVHPALCPPRALWHLRCDSMAEAQRCDANVQCGMVLWVRCWAGGAGAAPRPQAAECSDFAAYADRQGPLLRVRKPSLQPTVAQSPTVAATFRDAVHVLIFPMAMRMDVQLCDFGMARISSTEQQVPDGMLSVASPL